MKKDNTLCSCGRKKYDDAALCDICWNKSARYDERRGSDDGHCQCGAPKIADASMCSACWDRQSAAYGD